MAAAAHRMYCTYRHEDGAEEWTCPDCGRRIRFGWPPEFLPTTLDAGNETVTHIGGADGVNMVGVNVQSEAKMEIWHDWMDSRYENGIEYRECRRCGTVHQKQMDDNWRVFLTGGPECIDDARAREFWEAPYAEYLNRQGTK